MTTPDYLPSLPAGQRWEIKEKKGLLYLHLRRQTWYGWRTVKKLRLYPEGLGTKYALICSAEDILQENPAAW